jgi:hypothetical protein
LLGVDPPDVSGRYRKEDLTGRLLASDNGGSVGSPLTGSESTIAHTGSLEISSEGFFFTSGTVIAEFESTGTFIRGDANDYTTFSRSATRCIEDGSDYTMFRVGISTASVDEETGDILNTISLGVTVGTSGSLTTACANRYPGESELVGGWYASSVDRYYRIGDANE